MSGRFFSWIPPFVILSNTTKRQIINLLPQSILHGESISGLMKMTGRVKIRSGFDLSDLALKESIGVLSRSKI